ncbi:unnamed protein product [Dovyalis caffra]|uniref:Cystatin domain-containing protein n=1 Tax=Dovyalis caffra TaxID=77055 RepID=A0AAV1SBZ3_9ROSI|nr:unnamed protein product [Dovyalis caffra]
MNVVGDIVFERVVKAAGDGGSLCWNMKPVVTQSIATQQRSKARDDKRVSGYRGRMVGGRSEVSDVKTNKEVQELGRFSVKEFNNNRSRYGNGGGVRKLMFSEVVEAQKQVVSGLKYYLKIAATTQNGEKQMFDSEVVVRPWLRSKELLAFEPSTLELRGLSACIRSRADQCGKAGES